MNFCAALRIFDPRVDSHLTTKQASHIPHLHYTTIHTLLLNSMSNRKSLKRSGTYDKDEEVFASFRNENALTSERRAVYIINALILSIAPVCK